jgi:hypothetical protein
LSNKEPRTLKIPKFIMKYILAKGKIPAFCYLKRDKIGILFAVILVELLIGFFYLNNPNTFFTFFLIGSVVFFPVYLAILFRYQIFIRADCYNCPLSFHLIAHEKAHLSLNSSDENLTEREALKTTKDRLIPLLANQQICKDCIFWLRKIYAELA